jgi:hypothetical protein
MDEYMVGYEEGISWHARLVVEMLREQADQALAAGREQEYYALRAAAWRVESLAHPQTWAGKVYAHTGRRVSDILAGDQEALQGGHVAAHDQESGTYLVFVGYPDVDADGVETWPVSAARLVAL